MKKAAKEKMFLLVLIASAFFICAPHVASANTFEISKPRAEIFLTDGQNRVSESLFYSVKRDRNHDSLGEVALESCVAPKSVGKAFTVDPRVVGQLSDSRLGSLAGKITPQRLHELVNNKAARRFFDTRTGNINVIQEIEGKLVRVTVAGDKFKIISVGPIRERNILNLIKNGGFVPQ